MKKNFIILAGMAVTALFSCARIEENGGPQNRPLSFQVAHYAPQTKAGVYEGTSFKTSAWVHPDVESAQLFMDGETVNWQSASKIWSPDRPYYWPKSGYVNFFAWANNPEPTSVAEGAVEYGNAYAPVTLGITDDPLLASASYRFDSSNASANTYTDPVLYEGTDVTGVPILFHHMAAKVTIVVKFDASEVTANPSLKWQFKVNSATLTYANRGYVAANFTDPGTPATLAWAYNPPSIEWTWTHKTDLAGATPTQTVAAASAAGGDKLFDAVTVVPGVITDAAGGIDAKLALSYTLTDYWNDAVHITETVNYTGDDALKLAVFAPSITDWNMNYRYTYTVTVKPNAKITFDPAVEAWQDAANSATTL